MKAFVVCVALLLFASGVYAQQDEVYFHQGAEEYFLLGMRQYMQKEYKAAEQSLQQSLASYPQNHRVSASLLMLSKTLYFQKRYPESVTLLDSFLVQYPASLYWSDAHFMLGMNEYAQEKYSHAIGELLFVIEKGANERIVNRSRLFLEHIVNEYLSPNELQHTIAQQRIPILKNYLQLLLAEKYLQMGMHAQATAEAKEILSASVNDIVSQRAQRILSRIEKKNSITIGVLLPFMNALQTESREKKTANEILEGIRFALDEYESNAAENKISVVLDIKDSERNPAAIRTAIDGWKKNNDVVGIVGPVFSDEVSSAAEASNSSHIPLLSPTAMENGLAEKSKFVFLMNSDFSMRGKLMAQYAIKNLHYISFAILSPETSPSKLIADAFIEETKRLGATIVSDYRYFKGAMDLRHVFRSLRNDASVYGTDYQISFVRKFQYADMLSKLVTAGVSPFFADSLLAARKPVSVKILFGNDGKKIADSLGIPLQKVSIPPDSLNYSIHSIDAIFCPIASSAEIGVITSQLTYYNLESQLLGTSEWGDMNELDINKRYADGVIFFADRWYEENERYTQLAVRFVRRNKKTLNDNIIFGYDAMSLLLHQTITSREQCEEVLQKVSHYEGIRSKISFTQGRINSHLHILQFKKGKIHKIGEVEYQQ